MEKELQVRDILLTKDDLKPQLSTYFRRYVHFLRVTTPLNFIKSDAEIMR